jgi:CRP/FNR family transcriptional regulator, cyclic AMP receptor protein
VPAGAPPMTLREAAGFALFDGLPDAALTSLMARVRTAAYGRGETVIDHGATDTEVFLLIEGQLLARRLSAGGQEVGYRRLPQFSYFGELAALDGSPRSVSIIAVSDARVGVIAARDFRALLEEWPMLARKLLVDQARRVRELSDRLFEAGTVSVSGRVAAEVTRLALAAGVDGDGGIVADLPTHAELAALIGGQRETVTRALNRLVDAGIVAKQGRSLIIRNFEALLAQTGE